MTEQSRRKKYKRKKSVIPWLVCIIVIVITCIVGYSKLVPSFEQEEYSYSQQYEIYYNGILQPHSAVVKDGHVKLPLPLLDQLLEDSPIYYEEPTNTLVLTTVSQVLRFKTESLTALLNEKSYDLKITAEVIDDVVYIPAELIKELYSFHIEQLSERVIAVYDANFSIQSAAVSKEKGTELRSGASIKSTYYEKLLFDQPVLIWEQDEKWSKVQTMQGKTGYVKNSHLTLLDDIVYQSTNEQAQPTTHDFGDEKINLTWEAIYNRQPDLSKMPSLNGVNVVSPTWFELVDAEGTIQGKATHEYMKWARNKGLLVWALFSNGFEPDQTTEVLANAEKRFYMIQQLVAFAQLYGFDGINIDFENVYTHDKDNLVQFVREMMPIMREQGLVVSIDVTPKSNSEMWSAFIDREPLGKLVDYMMVMTYDEHWAASPKAGSVASLPWVEQAMRKIMEEDSVPAQKLILGVPLYTRIWSETPQEDGTIKVSSKSIGMTRAKEIIAEHNLTPVLDEASNQYYVEYMESNVKQRIWLEDEHSIAERIKLVHKYDFAGIATWARSFASPTIWDVMDQELNQ